MKYVGNVQSQANSEVYATASGTLPDGKPVVVNSDGTVSVVASETVSTSIPTTSNPITFAAGSGNWITSQFHPTDKNIFVIAYMDGNNSNYGTAIVGTISGNSITFSSPSVFESAGVFNLSMAFDNSNPSNFIIAYTDQGNSNYGTAIIGTISGTSLSYGTAVVFNSGATSDSIGADYLVSNKFVVAYQDGGNSNYGTAIIGTVSGTNISFGSESVFESAATYGVKVKKDPNATDIFVVAYLDNGNSNYGTSIVGTASGTSISYGSAVVFKSASTGSTKNGLSFDPSTANKFVIIFEASSVFKAIIGTRSGTSLSFGSEANIQNNAVTNPSVAYNPNTANQFVIAYRNNGNSNYGTATVCTVSSSSITVGTSYVYNTSLSNYNDIAINPDGKFAVSFYNSGASAATTILGQLSGDSPNLTTENFVGITNGVVEYINQEIGSEAVFENSGITNLSSAFDSNSNRVVVAYGDDVNSDYGTAAVGTVSGTSISFGTPVAFTNYGILQSRMVFDSNSNKIVIAWSKSSNNAGMAIVGTVDSSDNSISFGSEVQFGVLGHLSLGFDSTNNKIISAFANVSDNNHGYAIVGTVSGTSISFGSSAKFEAENTRFTDIAHDTDTGKTVIVYTDQGNSSYGTAVVSTVSGTSISFGTPVVYESANSAINSVVYDTNSNKMVIAYYDGGNSSYGTAIVGTVSGTGISFGTAVVFNSAITPTLSITFDSSISKIIIAYQDDGNSDKGTFVIGTVSGTSISFGSEIIFHNAATNQPKAVFDSSANKVVISYKDDGDGNKGKAVVVQVESETRGSTASGSTAIIQAGGAVNTLQTGLTAGQQYFVQTDGTLGLTADDPSVIAGTAVSATDLIVKG